MNIKIKTTETKITKSIISQMAWAGEESMRNGNVLGYMYNVHPSSSEVILIENNGKYTLAEPGWKSSTYNECWVVRPLRRSEQIKRFSTKEHRDSWFSAYQRILNMAEKVDQIYI